MSLIDGLSNERGKALLDELTFDQLCGLVIAKAVVEHKRVVINIRPAEARVSRKAMAKRIRAHYCQKRPAGLEGECQFSLSTGECLHCGRRVGEPHA